MIGIGAVFLPSWPPERLRQTAEVAEAAGVDELWLWEDCFREAGVAQMAATLAWTDRLRVGIGLLPVPMRNVALTAMEIATIARLFPDRARIGVGHGVLDWMGSIGARVASPLTLLGEHLDALRALLDGERVTVDGRYVHLDAVRLDWPPTGRVPILAGAEGPRTLELAGAKADGIIVVGGTSPDRLRAALERVRSGRDAAGRTGEPEVVVYLLTATGADARQRLEREAAAEWGVQSGDDAGVAGDAAAVADGVRRWIDAGATTVVLQPLADEPDPVAFVRFVGEGVRPLLD